MIQQEHIDKGYANSNGYFKDPVTGEWLSGIEPRVTVAAVEGRKFIWPTVRASDGSEIRITYKLFSLEEKEIYKRYRNIDEEVVEQHYELTDTEKMLDQLEEGPTKQMMVLASCDKLLGVSPELGYALLTTSDGHETYSVPLSKIDMKRLCGGSDDDEEYL